MRRILTAAMLVLGVAATAFLGSFLDIINALDYQLYDLKFLLRGSRSAASGDIAVVVIDQRSADSLRFPFDRRLYGELTERLVGYGAKLIVFDIDFSSPGASPASDSAFYAAIEDAGNVVLSGKVDFRYHPRLREPLTTLTRPSPTIAPPGTQFGMVNDFIDFDGITRRYPLYLTVRDTAHLSLGLKVHSVLSGRSSIDPPRRSGGDFIYAGLQIPTLPGGANTTLLNYYGPTGTFPTYSFIDLLRGVYDTESILDTLSAEEKLLLEQMGSADLLSELTSVNPFKGKIVLIGASAEDLQDNKFTPFFTAADPRKTPGVEVHAHALQMISDRSFLREVGQNWVIAATVLVSMLMFIIGRKLSQWMGLAAAAVILVGSFGISLYLFIQQGMVLREMPLLLAAALGYPANLLLSIIQAQHEKAMIRGMFSRYVSPKVVDSLIADPGKLKLGGERRRMSVLFTDVAGFTTVSERLAPEELVALLNEYLTAMTEVIMENDGIIDKYEGDLVMAEFGAPVWFEDHAARCCRAALGMQRRLAELRLKWRAAGRDELRSRVGINTGDMIIGNMGSNQVFDYTVMGDAVNLASRLEGANKNYGTTIMIGMETVRDLNGAFVTRPLDLLRVKGKTAPVAVYELLAEFPSEISQAKQKAVERYNEGLSLYRARRFAEARRCFSAALEADPGDSPSTVYIQRCGQFIAAPPPDDWDGAFTLTEK